MLGLELAADDYITKPFSVREFRSRVKAALRRAALARTDPTDEAPIETLDLCIDPVKRSDVDVDVPGDLAEVECDPERVAQVLRILMDNALVHTPPGTGIRVSAQRDNGEVRLAVTDTGLGIKRQTMPHIFEPFFTSNDDAQGAGLGLTIASELAERMSGRLEARSTPGATEFTLVLPA